MDNESCHDDVLRVLSDQACCIFIIIYFIVSTSLLCSQLPVPDQVAAWNAGNIAAFMHGYDHAESTTFVSQAKLQRGWASVKANYETRCDSVHEIHAILSS